MRILGCSLVAVLAACGGGREPMPAGDGALVLDVARTVNDTFLVEMNLDDALFFVAHAPPLRRMVMERAWA